MNESIKDQEANFQEPQWRARLRESRLGTLMVIGAVILIVVVAFVMANSGHKPQDASTGGGAVGQVDVDAKAAPDVGQPAPDFTATLIDGSTFKLSEHRGEPVWIIFQATWCAGCRSELDSVQASYESARDSGLHVLSVYVGEDADTVKGFINRMGLTFDQAADENTKLSSAYGVTGVPTHFFIAADGVISASHVGVLGARQMAENLAAIR